MIDMKVYEFYLNTLSRAKTFDELCSDLYGIGSAFVRVIDAGSIYPDFEKDEITPHPKAGQLVTGSAVYSISYNESTYWMQILVDDNTSIATITTIEALVNTLKDTDPVRSYADTSHNYAPIETPKHFTLDQVKIARRKQKDGTLGRIGL